MNINKKPIIGIVLKHYFSKDARPNMMLRDEAKQAIFDNGGIAIGITLPKDENNEVQDNWTNNLTENEYNNLISQINLCDGILFQGGNYCDNHEMIIAKYCYDNNIPTLGICCGQNVMVRALGGTTKFITNPEKHNNGESLYVHEVKLNRDSKFYNIIKLDSISVNSRHKKAVDTHPNLIVNCVCDDGYIDGVEAPDKKFYMAFRFHSESLYKIDKNHNKIFESFIDACKG